MSKGAESIQENTGWFFMMIKGYVMLSYLLTEIRHNVVLTTNFNHLTEDAVNDYKQKIALVVSWILIYYQFAPA